MHPIEPGDIQTLTLWPAREDAGGPTPQHLAEVSVELQGGDAACSLSHIARVSIAAATVLSHTVTRAVGSTSHFIRFGAGAQLRLAYSDTGELLELSAERVSVRLDAYGALLFLPWSGELSGHNGA